MNDDPDSTSSDSPDIAIVVRVTAPAWRERLPGAVRLVRRAARAAVAGGRGARGSTAPLEIGLVLADDDAVRRLNRDWRGFDKPTNVLSFPMEAEPAAGAAGPVLLGDVILAFETVLREADEQGKPLADHTCHLVVHGILHLLGHDHQRAAMAERMERLEAVVLGSLGIADPYERAPRRADGGVGG